VRGLARGDGNPALAWVAGGTIVFLAATLYIAPLRALFRFDVLHFDDLAICIGATALGTAWFELVKLWRTRHERHSALRAPAGTTPASQQGTTT